MPNPTPVPLLLASQSPARLKTLRGAGIEPIVVVSGVDEDAAIEAATERLGTPTPSDVALLLAQAKAQAVATALAEDAIEVPGVHSEKEDLEFSGLVLGCDSVFELDGVAYGKPESAAEAIERIKLASGRTGTLHTGHWILDERFAEDGGTGATFGAVASTEVTFADLTDAEIEAYVGTGEPLAVAGSFTIDGLGGPFITKVDGDHHNVVGLSLPLLREMLAEVEVSIPQVWNALPTSDA
ncbi:septum formation inhibitor Maf [Micrococcales bacterium 31B]|nr:septum formation inhibitor Maf [Micrococcales bacterium 31B]